MNDRNRAALAAIALLVAAAAGAHETGQAHSESSADPMSSNPDRPRRLGPDRLFVPKSVQHQLGLRTQPVGTTAATSITRLGEVLAHPDAPGAVTAPEPGRLARAADSPWPVPGQVVRADQVLAVLEPLMSERERAQRRAALAVIEQKLHVARVNAGRMRLQADARGGAPASENTYLEQAETELATQERIATLAREGLQGRVVLRAPAAGVIGPARVQPGDIVAAGDRLFDVGGAGRARLAVDWYDARAASRLVGARLADGSDADLVVRGIEPRSDRPGWRVLLDAPVRRDAPLLPGALVEVQLRIAADADDRSDACGGPTPDHIWVHVEPELFERRATGCTGGTPLQPDERVVVSGAALLDEYR